MTDEQLQKIRARAQANQLKQRQANWAAGLTHEIITRLAEAIVTRAVNTKGATAPAWADAFGRAQVAFHAHLPAGRGIFTMDISNAEKAAAEMLAAEDAPKETTEGTDVAKVDVGPVVEARPEGGTLNAAGGPQLQVLPEPEEHSGESH